MTFMSNKPKPDIITLLAAHAPSITISITGEVDPTFTWDGAEEARPGDDEDPYTVTVTATAIERGTRITGKAHLGGFYKRPDEDFGDVHGYLPDLIASAFATLFAEHATSPELRAEIFNAGGLLIEAKTAAK
jgi:hypothetical protein